MKNNCSDDDSFQEINLSVVPLLFPGYPKIHNATSTNLINSVSKLQAEIHSEPTHSLQEPLTIEKFSLGLNLFSFSVMLGATSIILALYCSALLRFDFGAAQTTGGDMSQELAL